MAATKRIIYSDADCHNLIDAVERFKNIVECKRTDAVTWKQKVATWDKIREVYNASTTDPRSSEQLRCKFDNLKKDVRKYEAQRRKEVYRTGGGVITSEPKAATKLLYDKVKSIIHFSVKGLNARMGDSDILEDSFNQEKSKLTDTTAGTSQQNELGERSQPTPYEPEIPPQPEILLPEINNDWGNYTPNMLKSKKPRVLQLKRRENSESCIEEDHKAELMLLKKTLLEREADRNEEFHQLRMQTMQMEKQLCSAKIENQVLQNKKLQMEISFLQTQFEGS